MTMKSMLLKPSSVDWTPHAYQKKAVKFLIEHAASALFLDPGLGKTSITLAAIKVLKKKNLISKVLLIAPLRVCYSVWPSEIQKWSDFSGLKIEILHGPKKEQALARDADIYIINPEGLEWLLQVEKTKTISRSGRVVASINVDLRRWKQLEFDTLVVDELSKFKNTSANRFKAIKCVLHTFQRRWGLTGSPAANGLLNLFGQCYILDEGRTLGRYITHYRMKYFIPTADGFGWIIRQGAQDEIYERLTPLALRMSAEDYLEMPEVIENNIYVDLPAKVMDVYKQLEEDLITKIESNIIVASNAGVASGKCRQVANGGIYLNQEVLALVKLPKSQREWVDLHDQKTDALEELVDELQGSPLLVAYDFDHDLHRLKARFPDAVFAGDYQMKDFKVLETRWNNGDIPLMFGHPQSLGHGLNLQQAGNHVAWHSMTWDYELYDQFNRRVLRQGNKKKRIFIHHILAKGTVDHIMLASIKAKAKGQNALFDALKALSKRR